MEMGEQNNTCTVKSEGELLGNKGEYPEDPGGGGGNSLRTKTFTLDLL